MKLVVVGGVAAGMSCAARVRRLDENAQIVVFERGEHVSFANCGLPYHVGGAIKERDRLLLQTPESLRRMLNLDVRVGVEVLTIDRAAKTVRVREKSDGREYDEPYEKLVLAPGAAPLRPALPGIDHALVFVLRNIADMDRIKAVVDKGAKTAVVIGGGYIGVEMAENLKARGLEVDLVEMADQIMTPLDPEMTHPLEVHMRWQGVRLHLGAAAAAFADDGGRVRVELVDGEMLTADLVIMAAGVKPESQLAAGAGLEIGIGGGIRVDNRLRTSDPDIYAGGDAVEVIDHVTGAPAQIPLAGPANRHGRIIADNLCGIDSVYTTTKGTAIVKVFAMTGGATGASEKRLKAAGRPYRKIYIHPSGHAGYYPGSATMHIKVLFDPDGALLGAQVVGYDGVDKRLDVFATALAAGINVQDLQHLELSYAPPYGSAKDPVNMAGFAASNLMAGVADAWYAEDYPEQTRAGQLIDVRSKTEYDAWHIPGSRLLPLHQLRDSLDQLDKTKPVFIYCKVGFRGYLAQRLLKQHGFDAKNLSGGTMTFCQVHRTGICPAEPEPPVISYAEEPPEPIPASSKGGGRVDLDLRGLQCPGPIRRIADALNDMRFGDELRAVASDPGFAADMPAWCRSKGHTLVSLTPNGADLEAVIRKENKPAATTSAASTKTKTMVVFSGDLDKVLAAFIIANGAVAMGNQVTLFFTFWGLNALRKTQSQAPVKSLLDRMFGMMMPRGAKRLKLSKMHMLGAGTAMMKHVMRSKNVDSLPDLMQQAMDSGVKLIACAMSMEVMGIKREELIDGIEIGGVARFLDDADQSNMTLFV